MRTPSRQIPTQRQAKQAFGWGKPQNKNARAGVDPGQALKNKGAGAKLVPSEKPLAGFLGKVQPHTRYRTPARQFYPIPGAVVSAFAPPEAVGFQKLFSTESNIMTTESNSNSQAQIEALQAAIAGSCAMSYELGSQIAALSRAGSLALQTPWGCGDSEMLARLFELIESLADDLVEVAGSLSRDAGCPVQDPRVEARHAARLAKDADLRQGGWE